MIDKEKIIGKIRKCLALAASSNEHEAAAAMRQAQKLMEMHNVEHTELLAAGATECAAHAGATKTPATWENNLAMTVSDAFGCRLLFQGSWGGGKWKFIGTGARPEIAQYAFSVLFRQLRRSRASFIKEKCKRLKPSSKTRRADLYCMAWTNAVASKAQAMSISPEEAEVLDAYMLQQYPETAELKSRDRTQGRKLSSNDWNAYAHGAAAGRNAQLNHGVSGSACPALIGN
jgi:hypothetical protein